MRKMAMKGAFRHPMRTASVVASHISYEVYALTDGRWQLHASLPVSSRDTALETAKQLDSEGFVDAVAVVRETFDPRRNRSEELVVYQGGRRKAPPPTSGLKPVDAPLVATRRFVGGVEAAVAMAKPPEGGTPIGPPLDRALTRMVDDAHRMLGLEIDAHTRFGLALFLAGMAEELGRAWRMEEVDVAAEATHQLVRLGFAEDSASALVANLDEYLLRNRFFNVYEAGRARTREALAGKRAQTGLLEALAMWAAPALDPPPVMRTREGVAPYVAVLASEIIQAARLRRQFGQAWESRILRSHDEVMREAFDRFGGREIRHLGQGMLGVFINVDHALEAALAVQRGVARFGELLPDHRYDLRIAVAVAEPIHDQATIHDTPVRLARRLLIEAEPGDVVVNTIAARIAAPRGAGLEWMRVVTLKGHEEEQAVYRVVRQEEETAQPATIRPEAGIPGEDMRQPSKRAPIWEPRR